MVPQSWYVDRKDEKVDPGLADCRRKDAQSLAEADKRTAREREVAQ